MNPLWLIPALGVVWLVVLAMALLVAARRGDDALARSTSKEVPMITRPRLAPDLRENHVPFRIGVACAVGAVACIAVAVTVAAAPPQLVVLAVGVLLGAAVAAIATLGRTGGAHLAADPDLPPEPEPDDKPEPRPVDVVHVMPAARSVRPAPYDDPLLATAEDAGVYQPRHSRELCEADTGVIPAVQA